MGGTPTGTPTATATATGCIEHPPLPFLIFPHSQRARAGVSRQPTFMLDRILKNDRPDFCTSLDLHIHLHCVFFWRSARLRSAPSPSAPRRRRGERPPRRPRPLRLPSFLWPGHCC